MPSKFSNNAIGFLSGSLSTGATSLVLQTGQGALFPALSGSATFRATLNRVSDGALEIVVCTARSGDTLTITRAQEGTAALAFVANDKCEQRVTAGSLNNMAQLDGDNAFTGQNTQGGNPIGYRDVPQDIRSADYTLVLANAAGHILHPSADTTARTFTIPANASVAFPIGTAITIVNQNAAGVLTIAITTDTMRLAGSGTTGSRTLAANGIATALKITATEWIISGSGLA